MNKFFTPARMLVISLSILFVWFGFISYLDFQNLQEKGEVTIGKVTAISREVSYGVPSTEVTIKYNYNTGKSITSSTFTHKFDCEDCESIVIGDNARLIFNKNSPTDVSVLELYNSEYSYNYNSQHYGWVFMIIFGVALFSTIFVKL